jgi:hypothetical protein
MEEIAFISTTEDCRFETANTEVYIGFIVAGREEINSIENWYRTLHAKDIVLCGK